MFRLLIITIALMTSSLAAAADDPPQLQEEVWALPLPLPTIAYVVRPVGDGPFPLAIMNHGVAMDPVQRSFFPLVEFRDAAMWFARRGYMVVAPSGSYGAATLEDAEAGLFSGVFFSKVGKCSNPNFHDAGRAVAKLNLWIIEYMSTLKRIVPNNVVVVGQSAGGWASIALSSVNPPPVKAIITFAAGRGGRVDGKPNNNCAPDKLVGPPANSGARRGCRCSEFILAWPCTRCHRLVGRRPGIRPSGASPGAEGLRGRVRRPRPARSTRHQIWRLAANLLQTRRRKDGLPHYDQRDLRDWPDGGAHLCDRARGR
jgi:hypothetical protein